MRVWLNGALVIDHWASHSGGPPDSSAAINLGAGQLSTVVVEYYQSKGTATMRLLWITPGNSTSVAIPAANLLSN